MNAATLIAVTTGQIDGRATQMADARLLHEFLGVGKDFTTWIRLRIRQYGFEQNRDYLLTQTGEQLPSGTKWRSDYLLTLDMAKELAMVERTPKGREARRYFIDCERQLQKMREQGATPITPHADYPLAINLLTADMHFGATTLRVGYRNQVETSWVSNLNTQFFTNSLVIGLCGEWMSLRPGKQGTDRARVISALY